MRCAVHTRHAARALDLTLTSRDKGKDDAGMALLRFSALCNCVVSGLLLKDN